jgi:hypothetical protein
VFEPTARRSAIQSIFNSFFERLSAESGVGSAGRESLSIVDSPRLDTGRLLAGVPSRGDSQ